MKFSKTLALSVFVAALSFGIATIASADFSPVEIKKVKRYATNIEITVPNMNLPENQKYYLYCEEKPSRMLSFYYRSPDKEWQIKKQPVQSEYAYSDTIVLSVRDTKEDRDYECEVSIRVDEPMHGKFLIRTSESKIVRTLESKIPNYKIYKKGVQAQYLNRIKPEVTRFVYPRPTLIVMRPRNYWNITSWGPEYYMASFYRQR